MAIQVIRGALQSVIRRGAIQRAASTIAKAAGAGIGPLTALREVFIDLNFGEHMALLKQAREAIGLAQSLMDARRDAVMRDFATGFVPGAHHDLLPGSRGVIDVVVDNPFGGEPIFIRRALTGDETLADIIEEARRLAAGIAADSPDRYAPDLPGDLTERRARREFGGAEVTVTTAVFSS